MIVSLFQICHCPTVAYKCQHCQLPCDGRPYTIKFEETNPRTPPWHPNSKISTTNSPSYLSHQKIQHRQNSTTRPKKKRAFSFRTCLHVVLILWVVSLDSVSVDMFASLQTRWKNHAAWWNSEIWNDITTWYKIFMETGMWTQICETSFLYEHKVTTVCGLPSVILKASLLSLTFGGFFPPMVNGFFCHVISDIIW